MLKISEKNKSKNPGKIWNNPIFSPEISPTAEKNTNKIPASETSPIVLKTAPIIDKTPKNVQNPGRTNSVDFGEFSALWFGEISAEFSPADCKFSFSIFKN